MVPYPSPIHVGWQCTCGQKAMTKTLVTENYLSDMPAFENMARKGLVGCLKNCRCGLSVGHMRMLVVEDGYTGERFFKADD